MKAKIEAAQHAMQSGVAMENNLDIEEAIKQPSAPGAKDALYQWHEKDHKHLRVGVNTALVELGALTRILIDKGILTQEEREAMMLQGMREEVARYEQILSTRLGSKVNLC